MKITAYQIHPGAAPEIVPSEGARPWMRDTPQHFADRCLPLRIANASGWCLLNPSGFESVWNGGSRPLDVRVTPLTPGEVPSALGHFGDGVLTFTLPYLFRTDPGWNLLARGPANWPRDGIAALEGVTETDWCPATFTMNYRFTRPGCPVRFEAGEPFCLLVPQRRGELEDVTPEVRMLSEDPEALAQYRAWSSSRDVFNQGLATGEAEICRRGWQKDYVQKAQQPKRGLCPFHYPREKDLHET